MPGLPPIHPTAMSISTTVAPWTWCSTLPSSQLGALLPPSLSENGLVPASKTTHQAWAASACSRTTTQTSKAQQTLQSTSIRQLAQDMRQCLMMMMTLTVQCSPLDYRMETSTPLRLLGLIRLSGTPLVDGISKMADAITTISQPLHLQVPSVLVMNILTTLTAWTALATNGTARCTFAQSTSRRLATLPSNSQELSLATSLPHWSQPKKHLSLRSPKLSRPVMVQWLQQPMLQPSLLRLPLSLSERSDATRKLRRSLRSEAVKSSGCAGLTPPRISTTRRSIDSNAPSNTAD